MKTWHSSLTAIGFVILGLAACSQNTYPDRSSTLLDSAGVYKVSFWPSGIHYVATTETVVVELGEIQRGYTCASVLESQLALTPGNDTMTVKPRVKVEIPGDPSCPEDLSGLDSSLRLSPISSAGISRLFLKNSDNSMGDTARLVTAQIFAETLSAVPDVSKKILKGRFTYNDSLKFLTSDSSLRCETLQGAVYTRAGDTVKVRFHRLLLDSTKYASLPPCAGKHHDSVNVVLDKFSFPKF